MGDNEYWASVADLGRAVREARNAQMYYDREGNPITLEQWGRLHNEAYKRVALDKIGDLHVSTVWLGIDHAFLGGPPLIFETMIFKDQGDHGDFLDLQWRYTTEESARKGHEAVCKALRDGEDLNELAVREDL